MDEPKTDTVIGEPESAKRGAERMRRERVSDTWEQRGFLKSEGEINRAEAALKSHGLEKPEALQKFSNKADWASQYELLKEVGMDKATYLAGMDAAYPQRSLFNRVSVALGTAGAGMAVAGVPVAQLIKDGRASWQSFVRAAPKTAAVGLVLGVISGAAMTVAANGRNERMRAEARTTYKEMEADWQKREAGRTAAAKSASLQAK
jgi:hypothetical protein